MAPFDLQEPRSLREAVEALDGADSDVRALGGGTALMLMMKSGVFRPRRLVSLRHVEPEYSHVESTSDGELRLGALATLSRIERSSVVQQALPVITRTLRTLSNVRVRNVATVGGHLAHADPHMDLPPVLIALGARVTTLDSSGGRTIPLESLVTGYYETVLRTGELIIDVRIPVSHGRRAAYLKCTTRSADDWPALGVAVSLDMRESTVVSARVVVSAATVKPTRLSAVETLLRDAEIEPALLDRAGEVAAEEANVVSDMHGSAAYRRQLVRVYVKRALSQALARKS